MSPELEPVDAPGLPADWLNAWLAAIGVTVLLPDVKLSWTDDVVPHAQFWVRPEDDLASRVAEALIDENGLRSSPIANTHAESDFSLPRNPRVEAFRDRCRLERAGGDGLLGAILSADVRRKGVRVVEHAPFNPPAPRGETIFDRAMRCIENEPDRDHVGATLAGTADRFQANGLGFDARRLSSGLPAGGAGTKVWVDPVVELLVLHAMPLFPFRGDGRHARQRAWVDRPTQRGALVWWAWAPRLDRWAIDAMLDREPDHHAPCWQLVPFRPSTSSDVTRAYASEPTP
jgi:hypothetical protein